MKKLIFPLLILVVVGGLVFFFHKDTSRSVSENAKMRIQQNFGKIPLYFEKNEGQAGDEIDFISRGQGYGFYVKPTESFFQISDDLLKMKLKGANEKANGSGLEEQKAKINYFTGNDPSKWKTRISTYAKVKYDQVYPGIDVVYYGNQKKLEYDFVVAPRADYKQVTLQFEGAKKIEINKAGDLVLTIEEGKELVQEKPKIYQEIDQEKKSIDGSYVLKGEGEVGFVVAAYDSTKPLVIDPVLEFSTYLGGGHNDHGWRIAVDSSGNAYVTGETNSPNFPTANAYQSVNSASSLDVFVTKLSQDGSALIYSTYLGGADVSRGRGIAVDSSGNAYVTGFTWSTNFPTTAGAFQSSYGGGDYDAFVTKLSSDGASLVYSTYLGGSSSDEGYGIAVDSIGNAYVTGFTWSTNFPTTNAYQSVKSTSVDVFVTKLNPNGSSLVYSTYLGGSDEDHGWEIAVDSSGNAYVTGYTYSTNFPTTAGALQSTSGGDPDAFVTKLNPDGGSSLVYSTYLGGSDYDYGQGIAVDSIGNAYVTGYTSSHNFPTTAGAFQSTGDYDAFVTKLSQDGASLIYSTYLGGSSGGSSGGHGIAVDSSGNAYVTGFTWSTNFPTTAGAFQSAHGGGNYYDAFVTKLSQDGASLIYSTYLGGRIRDEGRGIAVDSSGNAYVTGFTNSPNFPTTAGAFQSTSGDGDDVFVTKLGEASEVCDGIDNDGDGQIDEGFMWFGKNCIEIKAMTPEMIHRMKKRYMKENAK